MKMSEVVDFIDDPDAFEFLYEGKKVEYLNGAGTVSDSSRFFVAGFEFGPSFLIHVEGYGSDTGFETAYEVWIDYMPEIEKEEYPEAYSPGGEDREKGSFEDIARDELTDEPRRWGTPQWDTYLAKLKTRARELLDQAVEKARNEDGEWPEIVEGYREDSSGKVKSVGHYECFSEANLDEIEIIGKKEKPSE